MNKHLITIRFGQENDRRGIGETMCDGFFDLFSTACPEKETLIQILAKAAVPERFVVAYDAEQAEIVGTLSLSDVQGYPLNVDEIFLTQVLGAEAAAKAAKLLADEFYRPKQFSEGQNHIDNVAVRQSARKQGIARRMLDFAINNMQGQNYTLEVIGGHENVLPLYEAAGFSVVESRHETEGSLDPHSFRYWMRKNH